MKQDIYKSRQREKVAIRLVKESNNKLFIFINKDVENTPNFIENYIIIAKIY
jgi:hypothetical protein